MAKKTREPTVLLVNDDPSLSELIGTVLRQEALRVLSCQSVEMALVTLQEHQPVDLIITDLHMPEIDGWQFCRLLRSKEYASFNKVPVLVVSSTFSGSDAEEVSTGLGANAFLSAPFEPAVLQTYVRELLAGKTPQPQLRALVVAPDKAKAGQFRAAFESHGYVIHAASSGAEALRLVEEQTPAVVVVDYHLPDMSGDRLLDELKKARGSGLAVVMVASDPTPELALRFVRAGADAYAPEPFEPEYLVDVCEQARRRLSLLRVEELLAERTRELRESERKNRLLLDGIPESVLVHDENGNILHINEVGARRLESSPDELVGRNIAEFVTPENAKTLPRNIRRVLQDGSARFETTYVAPSGARIEVEVNERLIEFAGRQAILNVGRDVTARKEAERALRENEAKLKGMLSSLYETFIVVFDRDGRYVSYWGPPELDRRYGIHSHEIVGRTLADVFTPEDAADRLRTVRRVFDTRQSCRDEYPVHYPGGDFWHDITLSPLLDAAGEVGVAVGFVRDITELKRSQGALWDMSALLETTFDAIPDAISIQNADRKVVRCNRAAYRYFKISPGEAIGKNCFELVGRETPCESCVTSAVVETKQPAQTEVYFDKLGIWVDLRAYPVLDDAGNVVKVIEHMQDITERKRAEETVRDAERFLASVFASIQDGLFVLDTDCTIVRANPTMGRWYSHAMPLLGKKCYEVFHSRTSVCPNCPAHRTLQGGKSAYQIMAKQGAQAEETGWLEIFTYPLVDIGTGHMKGAIAYIHDITGRRESEAERVRLSTAVTQAAEAIVVTDRNGTINYVNPAFEQITGFGVVEVIGKNPRILKSGQQEAAFYRDMWETLTAGKVWRGRFVNKRKDGTLYAEDATISPIRDEAGTITNYVAVKRDVTEEIELEAQLRQAQKMEAIGNLAGGVAHDFNNLLTGILGYSNMLKSYVKPGDNVYRAAEVIERAANRAAVLTHQLLDFARKGERENVLVDMHATIEEVVGLLSRTIEKKIEITQKLGAERSWVLGDPGQMQQVILNLAVNARDAMPDGGKLEFSTRVILVDDDFRARCGLEAPGEYLLASVTDSGTGIPKHIQERIFEPFFTTKEKGKGTGMGLAMVYTTIKDHRGTISVYSEVGLGTTFRIYLPLATDAPAAESVVRAQRIPGTGRILVVDDEEIVRDVATRILESLGYEVATANDGREAVELYRQPGARIDLVIIDMVMPNMDGPDCFATLKKLDPNVRAIVSTGYGLDGPAKAVLEAGALGVAQKPYEASHLSQAVAAALQKKT
ncbi:MAG: PAS domain S-box protein [Kiritimatiellae bacterium]|nr:PAS domain S-box protein [Kiritimatiellia bacterium]